VKLKSNTAKSNSAFCDILNVPISDGTEH